MLLNQQEKKRKEDKSKKYIKTIIIAVLILDAVLCVVVMERVLTVPSSAQIAKIDNESFHQQKFKSAAGSSTAKPVLNLGSHGMLWHVLIQQGRKSSLMTSSLPAATTSSEQDHDNAMFGSEHISLNTTQLSVLQEEPMAASVKVCYINIMVKWDNLERSLL